MPFNYQKLRGKIKEICNTQDNFAKQLGLGRVSLSQKLNNQSDFTQSEIKDSCHILGLSENEIPLFFFDSEV